jgi:hypothetical protein
MARIRQIKPEFFLDDELAQCSRKARLMFAGLWCLADRAGRLEDRPARIKAQIFPYDEDVSVIEIDEILLEELARHFIERYSADGKRIIQIRTFEKHQHCHIKEPNSQLPPPPKVRKQTKARKKNDATTVQEPVENGSDTGQEPVEHRSSTSAFTSTYTSTSTSGSGCGEGCGEGKTPSASKSTPAPAPADEFVLTEELRKWTEEKLPDIDPETEAAKFRAYYGRNGMIFSDLDKAWQNWIFRAIEREQRARSPGSACRESVAERNARVFAEVAAEDAAKAKQAGGT